ncbi:hypothetical protein [Dongia sp. agr-C8]
MPTATTTGVEKDKVGEQVQRYIKRDKATKVESKQDADGTWTVKAEIPKKP